MSSLASAGRLDDACQVLDWMAEDGVEGNAVVYQASPRGGREPRERERQRAVFGVFLVRS